MYKRQLSPPSVGKVYVWSAPVCVRFPPVYVWFPPVNKNVNAKNAIANGNARVIANTMKAARKIAKNANAMNASLRTLTLTLTLIWWYKTEHYC